MHPGLQAIPHGIEYFSIQKTERINRLRRRLASVFQAEGFQELIPPLIDYASTFDFTNRGGAESLFEFRDASGEQLAIRSDLTVQTLKFALTGRTGQTLPAKFFYMQPVLTDRKAGSGRPREIFQAGVEWIGYDGSDRLRVLYDLALHSLDSLGHPYRFLYGDARFVDHLLSGMEPALREDISEALYFKDTATIRSLSLRAGLDAATQQILVETPLLIGDEHVLKELERLCQGIPALLGILNEAHRAKDLIYDFGMVRELSYYSGPVLEAYLHETNRKALSGGFYDGLGARFSKAPVPAAGFAVNLNEFIHLQDGKE